MMDATRPLCLQPGERVLELDDPDGPYFQPALSAGFPETKGINRETLPGLEGLPGGSRETIQVCSSEPGPGGTLPCDPEQSLVPGSADPAALPGRPAPGGGSEFTRAGRDAGRTSDCDGRTKLTLSAASAETRFITLSESEKIMSTKPEGLVLGCKAKDRITGYTGVVIAISEWLYGPLVVTIQAPSLGADGSPVDSHNFDVQRVEVVP